MPSSSSSVPVRLVEVHGALTCTCVEPGHGALHVPMFRAAGRPARGWPRRGRARTDAEADRVGQIGRGVHVAAQARPVAVERDRAAGGVRRGRAGPEARLEGAPRAGAASSTVPVPAASGTNRAGVARTGRLSAARSASARSAARSAGRSAVSAATGRLAAAAAGQRRGVRERRVEAGVRARRAMTSAPSGAAAARRPGSSVTTTTRPTAGQASAAADGVQGHRQHQRLVVAPRDRAAQPGLRRLEPLDGRSELTVSSLPLTRPPVSAEPATRCAVSLARAGHVAGRVA